MIGVGSAINLFEVIESGPGYEVRRSPYGSLRYINYKVKYGYDKMIKAVVSTPEDLESLEPPRPDMDQVMSVKKAVKQREGYFTTISHDTPFRAAWYHLRGFEPLLMDIVQHPSFARRLIDFAITPQVETAKAMVEEAGVHGVWLSGDLGNPHGPFISPKQYREVIYPWDRRIVEAYHRLGAFVIIHSHGNLNPILDDFLGAGFDGINPLNEFEGMDLTSIKERYGDRVTLVPQPASYRLEKMPKKLIESYVASQLRATASGGGLIYFGVVCNMLIENAEHYVNVFKKLRKYPFRSR